MSDAEKAVQIGNAITEYQAAKVEAAHLHQRVRTVFRAYLHAASSYNFKGTEMPPRLDAEGQLVIGHPSDRFNPGDLLNFADLEALVRERDVADKREEEALALVRSLGITGIS